MTDDVFTLDQYCEIEKICRTRVYKEWREGGGVEYFKRGHKIFITDEARLEYRRRLEEKAREERAKALAGADAA